MQIPTPVIAVTVGIACTVALVLLDHPGRDGRVPLGTSLQEAEQQAEAGEPAAPVIPDQAGVVIRIPDASIRRLTNGLPEDPAQLPTTAIAGPWSDPAADDWMRRTLATLETEITDPEIRKLAAEITKRVTAPVNGQTFYRVAKAALEPANSDDPAIRRGALYLLLTAALAGKPEPFAYFYLGSYFYNYPDEDGAQFGPTFYRHAADLDFLPGIVDTVAGMVDDEALPPNVEEAYLRYGAGLDGEDGHWHILNFVRDFYIYHHPERNSDGYLQKVVNEFREMGDEQAATETEYLMSRDGKEVSATPAVKLAAAKRALAAGNIWVAGALGYAFLNGTLGDPDPELARDYMVACLKSSDPDSLCATNLGAFYARSDAKEANLPLAVALFNYATDLDSNDENIAYAREQFALRMRQLTVDQIGLMDRYSAAIHEGNFAAIPHVRDARPVPELPLQETSDQNAVGAVSDR
ncbi:hypothetical protein [Paracoccus sp. (in: a-proteobacteria)]|uniref:hypothetical protein n=1 Tax=Paracoccus sp. TaxID=267 RepID=UPI003A83E5FD